MVRSYFEFRIKQIWRFLDSIGFGYILLTLVLLSGVLLQGISNILFLQDSYILLGFALLLLLFFTQRKDRDFLKSTDLSLFKVYIVDVLLLSLPLAILLFASGKIWPVIGLLFIAIFFALFWSYTKAIDQVSKRLFTNKVEVPFFSSIDFELKHLIRKSGLLISINYLICLIFAWHPASLFVLVFIGLTFLQSIFEYYEPKELILEHNSNSKFLLNKVFRLSLWNHLFLLPFYLIGLFFSPMYWYLYVLIFIVVSIMISFLVFNKYVFYRPGIYRSNTTVLASIMLIFMFIPGFQIVVFSMAIIQFFKATKNLAFYR